MRLIKYDKYYIEPNNGRFNLLIKQKRVNKKTKKTSEVLKALGYDFTFESIIKKIISLIIEEKINSKEESLTLKGYIEMYRQEVDKLNQIINLN